MCNCLIPSPVPAFVSIRDANIRLNSCSCNRNQGIMLQLRTILSRNCRVLNVTDVNIKLVGRGMYLLPKGSLNSRYKFISGIGAYGPNRFDVSPELGFKEKDETHFELDTRGSGERLPNFYGDKLETDRDQDDKYPSLSYRDQELKGSMQDQERGNRNERVAEIEDLFSESENAKNEILDHEKDEVEEEMLKPKGRVKSMTGTQLIKRSKIVAKQVITMESALNLGFLSQLWVDTRTWVVAMFEVRPNLLSSESEKFMLEEIKQVGDVVLVQDESGLENEMRMVGLETLVGYNVVTPGQRNLGKVRGFTFDINSGAVISLELDAFGISIIPTSLVTTYALFIEDVLDVLPDKIVVHEDAATHILRLTKGLFSGQSMRSASVDSNYLDMEDESLRPAEGQRGPKKSRKRKSRSRKRRLKDDWELPMDFL